MKDVIIVGGGCAGLTAALYAARAGKSVLVFEAENIGGQITAAPYVDNYPGIPHVSGMAFADGLYQQVIDLGVEVELDRVLSIQDTAEGKIVTAEGGEYSGKTVIIATGAKHRKIGLPQEDKWIGHGISYCSVCDGAFYKGSPVAVVGGGNTAMCDALFLASICESVTIIHRRCEFRADAHLLERVRKAENVRILTDSIVEELTGEKNLSGIRVRNCASGDVQDLAVEALFVAIGQVPQNAAFAHLLDTDEEGYLIAGEDARTNVAGIFAAGDCRTKEIRQLTTAVADGANAAMAAWSCEG